LIFSNDNIPFLYMDKTNMCFFYAGLKHLNIPDKLMEDYGDFITEIKLDFDYEHNQ